MPQLVAPHHSEQLKPLLLPEIERGEERRRAEKLKKVPLDSRAVSDVFMLACLVESSRPSNHCFPGNRTGRIYAPIARPL